MSTETERKQIEERVKSELKAQGLTLNIDDAAFTRRLGRLLARDV